MADSASDSEVKKAAPRKASGHPTMYKMVLEALSNTAERKGSTIPALKSYINEKYPFVDPNMISFRLRKALEKGQGEGIIIRPKGDESTGLTGRFRLDKAKQAELAKRAEKKPAKKEPTKKTEVKKRSRSKSQDSKKATPKAKRSTPKKTSKKTKEEEKPKKKVAKRSEKTTEKTKKTTTKAKKPPAKKAATPKAKKAKK